MGDRIIKGNFHKHCCIKCHDLNSYRTRKGEKIGWDYDRHGSDEVNWFNRNVYCPIEQCRKENNERYGRRGWLDLSTQEPPESCPFKIEHEILIQRVEDGEKEVEA